MSRRGCCGVVVVDARRFSSGSSALLGAPGAFIGLNDVTTLISNGGAVMMQSGRRTLMVEPLLSFKSCSPDRCWTLLAPFYAHADRRALTSITKKDGVVHLAYRDADVSTLMLKPAPESNTIHLDARSRLLQPVWSHLNRFASVAFISRGNLSLSFSPCAAERIAILPSDYPVGRAARFAYVDAQDVFHVVEARSGEKGPFRELASGPLERDAPLTLVLYAENEPVFRVTLDDWAAQASRQLSPTAGWKVPANSIEFVDRGHDAADIFISLAATSVGRGFDTVGHAPGVYRNRMTCEILAPGAKK